MASPRRPGAGKSWASAPRHRAMLRRRAWWRGTADWRCAGISSGGGGQGGVAAQSYWRRSREGK
jgi:hypothetical protein